jgi:multiple sugar transport system substrate-binding protein
MNTERDVTTSSSLRISRRRLLEMGAAVTVGGGLLSACGGSSSGSSGISTSAQEDFTGVTLQTATRDGGGVDEKAPGIRAAIDSWEKRTGGKVAPFTIVGFNDLPVKWGAFYTTQDPSIDILYSYDDNISEFGSRLYEDLSTVGGSTSDFLPATLAAMTNGGKLRALPLHSEMLLYIYNKEMYDKAGLDPASSPVTWSQLYDAAPKLRSGNRYPNATTILQPGTGLIYYEIYLNSIPGARLLTPDLKKVAFNNADGLDALQTWHDGITSGFYDPNILASQGSSYETAKMFEHGQTASMVNYAQLWAESVDPKKSQVSSAVGAALMPGVRAGGSGSSNATEGFGVNVFSKNKAAALSFVKEMTDPGPEKVMNLAKTFPSSRKSVLNDPEVVAAYPLAPVLEKQGATNLSRSYGAPYINDVIQAFDIGLTDLWRGHTDVPGAMDELATKTQKVIDDYYSH